MMTSVLMSGPYFQTRPRNVFMRCSPPFSVVVCRLGLDSCGHQLSIQWSGGAVPNDGLGTDKLAGDSRGRGHGRVGQIDLRAPGAHTADKVAIGGRDTNLVIAQHAHVASDARPAG